MSDARFTHRPSAVLLQGPLEVLVYLRQNCTTHALPPSGVVRIGRDPLNDIRVDDPSVSRHHFALHIGGAMEVEDVGSANGTQVFRVEQSDEIDAPTRRENIEARLSPGQRRLLEPGDFVRAGAALILVQPRRPSNRVSAVASSDDPAHEGPAVLLDPQMKRAYEVALRAAQSNISVLITGETGSGKEVFAETIHQRSNRRGKPFLRLNCAALTESLLESQLFGHERGAFTGANQAKAGLLESTDQGSVFLDEIGEMPLTTQAKLLRVLEERAILRVGATKPTPIDVRFIWATNRDLRAEANAGRFRSDLYYRIAGVEFSIPPLRNRLIEIEPLARLFLRRFCELSHLPEPEITPSALAAMQRYSWPGNVRELKNVMERAPFVCEGGQFTEEHVPQEAFDPETGLFEAEEDEPTHVIAQPREFAARRSTPAAALNGPRSMPAPLAQGFDTGRFAIDSDEERQRVLSALEQCAGNQTRAAKVLGVSRRTLINRLERLNMPRPKKV
ncbi:MAG: sigma 54-interacting transcriptional regulator [Myxococcales bacterium]